MLLWNVLAKATTNPYPSSISQMSKNRTFLARPGSNLQQISTCPLSEILELKPCGHGGLPIGRLLLNANRTQRHPYAASPRLGMRAYSQEVEPTPLDLDGLAVYIE